MNQVTQAVQDAAKKTIKFVALAVGMYFYTVFYLLPKWVVTKIRENFDDIQAYVVKRLHELYEVVFNHIKSRLAALMEYAQTTLRPMLEKWALHYFEVAKARYVVLKEQLNQYYIPKATEIFNKLKEHGKDALNRHFVSVTLRIKAYYEQVIANIESIKSRVRQFFVGSFEAAFNQVKKTVQTVYDAAYPTIEKYFVPVTLRIKAYYEQVIANIESIKSKVRQFFVGRFEAAFNQVKKTIQTVYDAAYPTIEKQVIPRVKLAVEYVRTKVVEPALERAINMYPIIKEKVTKVLSLVAEQVVVKAKQYWATIVVPLYEKFVTQVLPVIKERVTLIVTELVAKAKQIIITKVVPLYEKFVTQVLPAIKERVILIVTELVARAKQIIITKVVPLYEKFVTQVLPFIKEKATFIATEIVAKAKQYFTVVLPFKDSVIQYIRTSIEAAKKAFDNQVLPILTSILDLVILVQQRSASVYKQSVSPYLTEEYINSAKKSVTDSVDQFIQKVRA
jgi:hypothetical protein